jgi:hypothetical protein
MKWISISTTLLLSALSMSFNPGEGEIKWPEGKKLTYSDFEGRVPPNTPWAALTSSNIYFTYQTSNGKLSSFLVYASFRKKNSWIKIKNEAVLNHEQLHFDITETFTRKLYKEISLLKDSHGDIPKQVTELFKRINNECDQMQQQYDAETQHGTLPEEQESWKKKVEKMLSDYPPYPEQ